MKWKIIIAFSLLRENFFRSFALFNVPAIILP